MTKVPIILLDLMYQSFDELDDALNLKTAGV
jgi:hypothetical protein